MQTLQLFTTHTAKNTSHSSQNISTLSGQALLQDEKKTFFQYHTGTFQSEARCLL